MQLHMVKSRQTRQEPWGYQIKTDHEFNREEPKKSIIGKQALVETSLEPEQSCEAAYPDFKSTLLMWLCDA